MRVRISYGIEIEEIPETAQNLGLDALYKLKETIRVIEQAINNIEECNEDYTLVIQMLEKARLELTNSDMAITDLQAILEGLQNFHNGDKNVSKGRSTVDSGGNTTEQTEDSGKG